MTPEAALDRVTAAAHAARQAAVARDDAIRAAREHCTLRAIAAAAGLSFSRVFQIGQQGE